MPRSSSASLRKVSASSSNKVGLAISMVRNMAAVVTFAAGSARQHTISSKSRTVVLPLFLTMPRTCSRGECRECLEGMGMHGPERECVGRAPL